MLIPIKVTHIVIQSSEPVSIVVWEATCTSETNPKCYSQGYDKIMIVVWEATCTSEPGSPQTTALKIMTRSWQDYDNNCYDKIMMTRQLSRLWQDYDKIMTILWLLCEKLLVLVSLVLLRPSCINLNTYDMYNTSCTNLNSPQLKQIQSATLKIIMGSR